MGYTFQNMGIWYLRIVIMNLKTRQDTHQGFVWFIIPAPTLVYIPSESEVFSRLYPDVIGIFTSKLGGGGGGGATFKIRLQPKLK
jgi:hypothetical protein